MSIFDDQYTNGGPIINYKVAAIPFYQYRLCLVSIRQSSLTKEAYRYFKLFQDQTQNTGDLADTPPTPPIGNMHNVAGPKELVVGCFTASAVSAKPIYIDRKDCQGYPLSYDSKNGYPTVLGGELFYALYQRQPNPELHYPEGALLFIDKTPRHGSVCPINLRTPVKPEGWRN